MVAKTRQPGGAELLWDDYAFCDCFWSGRIDQSEGFKTHLRTNDHSLAYLSDKDVIMCSYESSLDDLPYHRPIDVNSSNRSIRNGFG